MEYQLYLRDHGIREVWGGSDLKDHPVPTPSSHNKPAAYSSHPASVTVTTSQSDRATLRTPALSSQPACSLSSQTHPAHEGCLQVQLLPLDAFPDSAVLNKKLTQKGYAEKKNKYFFNQRNTHTFTT